MEEKTEFLPAPIKQNFCSNCGAEATRIIPPDDNRERDVCYKCHTIMYRNPLVVVGAIPVYQDKVLLCKRAIEPQYGKWTFPAGFLELNESTVAGAARETLEESGAEVIMGDLFTVIDVPEISQLHVYYLAECETDALDPGIESLEAGFYSYDEIPWDEIAFRTIKTTLEYYFEDKEKNNFQTHYYSLTDERLKLKQK